MLGRCKVCDLPVCTLCGNTQRHAGGTVVVHDACLGDLDDPGFSMIKFVK